MKRLAILAACALTLQGCATYEVAVGVNTSRYMPWSQGADGGFNGPLDTIRFSARRDLGQNGFCQVSHISHLSAGWPFNDKTEDWLDMAECGVRFGEGNR